MEWWAAFKPEENQKTKFPLFVDKPLFTSYKPKKYKPKKLDGINSVLAGVEKKAKNAVDLIPILKLICKKIGNEIIDHDTNKPKDKFLFNSLCNG